VKEGVMQEKRDQTRRVSVQLEQLVSSGQIRAPDFPLPSVQETCEETHGEAPECSTECKESMVSFKAPRIVTTLHASAESLRQAAADKQSRHRLSVV